MSCEEVFESLLCTFEAERVTGMRLSLRFTSAVRLQVSPLQLPPRRFISRTRPNVRGENCAKRPLASASRELSHSD